VDIKTTNYYFFNNAAKLQVDLVVDVLKANNIYPIGTPKETIVTTKFKSKKGNYIGVVDKGIQYYPKMAPVGITLEIIKPTAEHLQDGDIIEIKTEEEKTKGYCYLGAWMTTALYYYTRAYSESSQKWMIEKVDATVKEIKDGDAVRFKNMYYTNKPYMATYDYWAGGTFLTTQKDNKPDNAIWIMDGLKEFDIFNITPNYFVSDILDLETSTHIHDDMHTYGLIDEKDKADVKMLKTTLDSIGLGFLTFKLTDQQHTQVLIQLEKVVNSD
jgi:hypothetical protein